MSASLSEKIFGLPPVFINRIDVGLWENLKENTPALFLCIVWCLFNIFLAVMVSLLWGYFDITFSYLTAVISIKLYSASHVPASAATRTAWRAAPSWWARARRAARARPGAPARAPGTCRPTSPGTSTPRPVACRQKNNQHIGSTHRGKRTSSTRHSASKDDDI